MTRQSARAARPAAAAVLLVTVLLAGLLAGCSDGATSVAGAGPGAPPTTTSGPPRPSPAPGGTAAAARGWGPPSWSEDFSGSSVRRSWALYDSPDDAAGRRRPAQVAVADGVMTQTGTADATTGGMALRGHDERSGRWEVRVRADHAAVGGTAYRAVVVLVPTGVPYAGGERDLDLLQADVGSPTANFFLHHPPRRQDYAQATVDLAQWHSLAVEVAPGHVTWFVDGDPMVADSDPAAVPTTPMALAVQLDADAPGGMVPARLQLDWARYYPLPPGPVPAPAAPAPQTGDYDPSS